MAPVEAVHCEDHSGRKPNVALWFCSRSKRRQRADSIDPDKVNLAVS